MKTEGLSRLEAIKALLAGNFIKAYDGECACWLRLRESEILRWGGEDRWAPAEGEWLGPYISYTIAHKDPSIPEPKSLTAEEATKLLDDDKKIQVLVGKDRIQLELGSAFEVTQRFNDLISYTTYLDLAERKGWPITEVQ